MGLEPHQPRPQTPPQVSESHVGGLVCGAWIVVALIATVVVQGGPVVANASVRLLVSGISPAFGHGLHLTPTFDHFEVALTVRLNATWHQVAQRQLRPASRTGCSSIRSAERDPEPQPEPLKPQAIDPRTPQPLISLRPKLSTLSPTPVHP